MTRTVRVEAVLLVVLLGVTGVLVNQSPRPAPVTAPSGTTGVGTATAGDLRVLAVMDPRRTGSNTVLVQVQDASGEPYDPPVNPVVELRTDGLDLGAVDGDAHRRRDLPRPGRGAACRGVGGAGQHRAEPLRQPGDDGQADGATVRSTGTVCRKPSTRTCTKSR